MVASIGHEISNPIMAAQTATSHMEDGLPTGNLTDCSGTSKLKSRCHSDVLARKHRLPADHLIYLPAITKTRCHSDAFATSYINAGTRLTIYFSGPPRQNPGVTMTPLPPATQSTTQCIIAQHSAQQEKIVQYSTTQYIIVPHSTPKYNIVQHSTTQYNIVHHSTTYYTIVQHSTTQYNIVQHSTAQYIRIHPSTLWCHKVRRGTS